MIGPLCPWFLPHHKHRTMERVMELTLSGHRFETSLIYLVDVSVYAKKFAENLEYSEVFVWFLICWK